MALNPKLTYPTQIDTTDPSGYPYGKARNISVPGDGTGTPWEKQIINDALGFQQAILDAGDRVPSNVADKVGASQYLDALTAHVRGDIIAANITYGDVGSGYTGGLHDICYSPSLDLYLAVADSAKVFTSKDAITWTQQLIGGAGNLYGCAWCIDQGIFVIVGASAKIYTSSIGTGGWSSRTADGGYAGDFYSVASTAGKIVIGGFHVFTGGEVQWSTDGVSWTQGTLPAANRILKVARSDAKGLFIAVGESGGIFTSPTGATWTQRTPAASYTGYFYSVSVSETNGEIMISGGTSGEIQWSSTGTTWVHRTPSGAYAGAWLASIRSDDLGRYFFFGSTLNEIQTTVDTINFSRKTGDTTEEYAAAACVGRNKIVLACNGGRVGRSMAW